MKDRVYKNPLNTHAQLWQEINAGVALSDPMVFNMRRSFMNRMDKCIIIICNNDNNNNQIKFICTQVYILYNI